MGDVVAILLLLALFGLGVFVGTLWKRRPQVIAPRLPSNLRDLGAAAFMVAQSKGWHDTEEVRAVKRGDPIVLGALLALIHSEVSEALEDARSGNLLTTLKGSKPVGFPSELADAVMRIAGTAHMRSINLDDEVARKMAYNRTRKHKHGGKAI